MRHKIEPYLLTMALSRVVSEIFNVVNVLTLKSGSDVFNTPAEGVPLGIGYRHRGQKKLE